jgi:hypothetical protein
MMTICDVNLMVIVNGGIFTYLKLSFSLSAKKVKLFFINFNGYKIGYLPGPSVGGVSFGPKCGLHRALRC